MNAVTLRGLLTRKLRTILTMIAIILGVSMISGTYVLTDTINNSFQSIFSRADRNIDAVVVGKAVVKSQFSLPPPMPSSILNVVLNTPGVATAEGEVADSAQLFDRNGKQIGGLGGAPSLLFSVPSERFRTSTLVRGREPVGREFVVDETTANRSHLKIGQTIGVASVLPLEQFRLSGIIRFGGVGSLGGATLVETTLAEAQRIADKIGKYDQISIAADTGVSRAEVVRRVAANIPPALRGRVEVKTSEQNVADQTKAIGDALNFLTIALLTFGGIAVFVGAFIIFNTFSITVAQRTREFGLLRTIGATRGQILRSVIGEALLIGIAASLLGLFAGFGIARGLGALFIAFGIDLPNAGLVVAFRTVVVALLVGTLVTLAASTWPAFRATRIPPIAALREGSQLPRGRFARYTPAIATVLGLLGLVCLLLGVFASISDTSQRLLLIGLGAVLLFVGVAAISPRIIGPMAAIIGWPIERLTAITGRLARENATRNPTRTAVTAAALMIGLALVGFVTIFAAELKKTAADIVSRELAGTFVVYSQQGPISQGVAGVLHPIPGVAVVSPVKSDAVGYTGAGTQQTTGIEPRTAARVFNFQWKQGSAATLQHMGPRDALISDNFANDHHAAVGSVLHATTATGAHDAFHVIGIFKNSDLLSGVVVPYATLGRDTGSLRDQSVIILADSGQNLKALQKRISRVLLAHYPNADVHSQQDIKDQQNVNVNQLLALIYVLLAMSVLVSLFGIINTLVLSVYERTREIGMLRAIGTTRSQVRWMVRWESVITAEIGAILGLLLGVLLAVIVTQGLSSQGIEFAFPIGQLLIWVVFAILFGIVAAAFPARRAARLDVLRAVAYE